MNGKQPQLHAPVAVLLALLLTAIGQPALGEPALIRQQREIARRVLSDQCGPCHTLGLQTSKPGALAIFNLEAEKWEQGVSRKQRQSIVSRLEQRISASTEEIAELMPKGFPAPPRPTSEDIANVRQFLELGDSKPTASKVAIDVHMHAFSDETWSNQVTGDDLIKAMDEAGVAQGVVISAGYFEGPWRMYLSTPLFGRSEARVRHENDYVAGLIRSHPARLIGACGVHPLDSWAMTELDRCVRELGFKVVKVHPNAQRFDMDDPQVRSSLRAFFEEIGRLNAVALVHAYGRTPDFQRRVLEVALETPATTFIFAHAFGDNLPQIATLIEKAPSNVFVDISGTAKETSDPQAFVGALRQIGLSRVLFGSDYPVFSPKQTLDALRQLPLTESEVALIVENRGPFTVNATVRKVIPIGRYDLIDKVEKGNL